MVTFINGIRVPAECTEEFLVKWDRGADYVRRAIVQHVVVTGISTGIGYSITRLLIER